MKVRFAGVLCILACTLNLQGQSREVVLKAVGAGGQWNASGKATEYDETTIQKLAGDQQAAIIESYGLVGVSEQEWSGAAGKVRLTLYEMLDSTASYGLFTAERELMQSRTPLSVGTEGFRSGNRSFFWQAKYLVTLQGNSAASDALARTVSENILGKSQKPPVSILLPTEHLVQGTEKYVVDSAGIARNLQLDPGNLGFDSRVEIATAKYRVNGKTADLVLLLYPTQQIAKKHAEQWDAVSPDQAGFRKRTSNLLALVRGVSDTSVAETILGPVNNESDVTWNEPPPTYSFPEMILTIFAFTGIALLFTLIVGISYGGLRIFVKARYPDRVFDRPEHMEIIQLKLGQGLIRKEIDK